MHEFGHHQGADDVHDVNDPDNLMYIPADRKTDPPSGNREHVTACQCATYFMKD